MQHESSPQSVASSIDGSRGQRQRSSRRRLIAGGLAVSVAAAGIAVIGVGTTPQVSSAVTPTCSYANNPMLVLQLNNSTATVIGSSTVPGFVGDIPLQNVNFGSSQQYSLSTIGAGAGKLSFAPLTFTKPVDPTSPLLFANEANGTPYGFATIYSGLCAGTATPTALTTVKLGFVAIKSISTTLDPDTETISLVYGAYQVTTRTLSATGVFSTPVSAGWDALKNVAWNGTTAP